MAFEIEHETVSTHDASLLRPAGGRGMTGTITTEADWSAHRGLVALAVGYQWFYNDANFLAFKIAGNALHPLMVATLRFSIAALILLPFALVRWRRFPCQPVRWAVPR